MTQMLNDVAQTLNDDLYQKTRSQLNTFLNETNALLAAGDALHEDRTAQARARLVEFLESRRGYGESPEPPFVHQPTITRVLNDAQRFVRANPWAAVGAAAGVGMVVSLLLARRSR